MASARPLAASIIVPAYREPELQTCIDHLLMQDFDDPFEVVVCVSADSEHELPALRPDPRLTVLPSSVRVPAAIARNRAVAASRGELFAFTDGDALVAPDWLSELVRASDGKYCVAGAVKNGTPDSEAGTVEYLVEFLDLHPLRPEHTLWHGATCNLLIPRNLWEEIGPFPEDLEGGEDTLVTILARARDLFRFAPAATVTHYNRTRWSSVVSHQAEIGRFTARLGRRSAYKWRPLVRYTALAPIATAGRVVSIYARVLRWAKGSRLRAFVLAPGVMMALVGWGWGLAVEGARLDFDRLMARRARDATEVRANGRALPEAATRRRARSTSRS